MTLKLKLFAVFGAALLICGTVPASAQMATRITEGKVRFFYTDLRTIFQQPYDVFIRKYDERIHPSLSYTSRMQVQLDGVPVMDAEPTVTTKQDILAKAPQAYEAGKKAVMSSSVSDIQIAADGKTARVKSVSTIRGMDFPMPDGTIKKADSTENCNDELTLNDQGILQIIKSDCDIKLIVK